jgi:hypothetical protein
VRSSACIRSDSETPPGRPVLRPKGSHPRCAHHAQTQTHRDTETQNTRNTETQTLGGQRAVRPHASIPTPKPARSARASAGKFTPALRTPCANTHTHTHTHTHTPTQTQTHRHTDTQTLTHTHTHTRTHMHPHACAQCPLHTCMHTHTHTITHNHTHSHSHRPVDGGLALHMATSNPPGGCCCPTLAGTACNCPARGRTTMQAASEGGA